MAFAGAGVLLESCSSSLPLVKTTAKDQSLYVSLNKFSDKNNLLIVRSNSLENDILLIKNNGKIDIDTSVYIFRTITKDQTAITTSALKNLKNRPILTTNSFSKSWHNLLTQEIKSNTGKENADIRKERLLRYQRAIDQLTVKNLTEKNKEKITRFIFYKHINRIIIV